MSALALRIIAALTMLLDHIGYFSGCLPLRYIGRIAFPLYVFLMVNGFRYTKNRLRYALRFGLFAVISQLPYMLLTGYPFLRLEHIPKLLTTPSALVSNMNVMVTLLLALLAIWFAEALRKNQLTRYLCLIPAFLLFCAYHYGLIRSDYGGRGVLLAVVFWLFDSKKLLTVIGVFGAMLYPTLLQYGLCLVKGLPLMPPNRHQIMLAFSLLALPFIWLYNQKPGRLPQRPWAKKAVQLGFYAFYPLHLMVLWAIF